MIFPLLAKPITSPWNEFSLEQGIEAMSIGKVPAIQAALSSQTIPNSIFGQYPDEKELKQVGKVQVSDEGKQILRWVLKNNRHLFLLEKVHKKKNPPSLW